MKLTKQILKRLIMEELSEAWKDDEEGYVKKVSKWQEKEKERIRQLETSPEKAKKELAKAMNQEIVYMSSEDVIYDPDARTALKQKMNVIDPSTARQVIADALFKVYRTYIPKEPEKLAAAESLVVDLVDEQFLKMLNKVLPKPGKDLKDIEANIETAKARPANDQYREGNIRFWENEKLIYQRQLRNHQRSLNSLKAFKMYLRTLSANAQAADVEATRGADDIDISRNPDMPADDVDIGPKTVNETKKLKIKISK